MSVTPESLAAEASQPQGSASPGFWARRALAHRLLLALASLRLSVVILATGVVLVYAGTMAQIDHGIWQVVSEYFHSFWLMLPIDSLAPSWLHTHKYIPFPGGWTVGGLMMINMLAAFVVRLKWNWRGSGLILAHLGMVVLLVGEVIYGVYADEGNMSISEGGSSNYTVDNRSCELVVIDHTAPDKDFVVAIPRDWLRSGETIRDPRLPVAIKVDAFMGNSVLRTPDGRPPQTAQDRFGAVDAPEVAGTNTMDDLDMPSAYLTLSDLGTGKKLRQILVSSWLSRGQILRIGGHTYQIALRFRRVYRPYRIYLQDFSVKRYLGTAIPSSFTSVVRLVDDERGVDRKISIWMNHPLRYRGETYYQASFTPDERGTVLQVVRNAGWLAPYLATVLVTLGMLIQFTFTLSRFIRRRSA